MRKILIPFLFFFLSSAYSQPDYAWLLNNSTAAQTGAINLTQVSGAAFSTARVEGSHSGDLDKGVGNRFETNSELDFGDAGLVIFFNFQNWWDGATHTTRTIIDTREAGTGEGLWIYADLDVQRIIAVTSNGTDTGSVRTTSGLWTPAAGSWVSGAFKMMDVDGIHGTLWVNGVKYGTDSVLQSGWYDASVMAIGCARSGTEPTTFWGKIDNVQVYTCALDATEILALYTNRATYTAASCPSETGCDPIVGGTVAAAQTIDEDDDVAAFTSSAAASGGSSSFTYQWQYSTTSSTAGSGTWYDIVGATSATYNHGTLSSTTWFTRKAIDAVCGNGYSNVLKITVTGSTLPGTPDLTKWYFDADAGSDFNEGHSIDLPLQTMAHLRYLIAGDSLDPGDSLFFKKGGVWTDAALNFTSANSGTYGNDIVLTSYGSGNKPVFQGTTSITSFDTHVGNVWGKTITALPNFLRRNINRGSYYEYRVPFFPGLFIDGTYYSTGKYPNTGFYTAESSDGTTFTYIQDNNMSWTQNWSDGCISIATSRWVQNVMKITSNSSTRLNLSNTSDNYEPGCGPWDPTPNYRIINSLAALDVNGEHSYNHGTQVFSIYYSGTLTDHVVEVTTSDTIINTVSASYLRFDGLEFKGAAMMAVQITGGSNVDVVNCKISYAPWGINLIADSCEIDGNEIVDIQQEGIAMAETDTCIISDNIIKRMGIDYVGITRQYASVGIRLAGDNDNFVIKYNRIDSTSYSGINHKGMNNSGPFLIYGNMISNWHINKCDGAAIYSSVDSINVSKIIRRNICFNSGQAAWQDDNQTYGIYMDAGSWHFTIDSNTVYNVPVSLYLHGHNHCKHHTIHDNTFVRFNTATKDYFQAGIYVEVPATIDAAGLSYPCLVNNLDIKHNYLVSTDSGRSYGLTWNGNSTEATVTSVGSVMDSNYFFNPTRSDNKLLEYRKNWVVTNTYTTATWFSTHAFEQHSLPNKTDWRCDSVPDVDEDSVVWVFINASNISHDFDLGDVTFLDLDSTNLTTTLTLPAYTAKSAFYVDGNMYTVDDPLNDELVEEEETPPSVEVPAEIRRRRIFIFTL